MTLQELIDALVKIRDAYHNGGNMPVMAFSKGDPSVGIWDYCATVVSVDVYDDIDEETGKSRGADSCVIELED